MMNIYEEGYHQFLDMPNFASWIPLK